MKTNLFRASHHDALCDFKFENPSILSWLKTILFYMVTRPKMFSTTIIMISFKEQVSFVWNYHTPCGSTTFPFR